MVMDLGKMKFYVRTVLQNAKLQRGSMKILYQHTVCKKGS